MGPLSNEKLLERAEREYLRLNLREAYRLFRRSFDKLPLGCLPIHLKYMGMFVRTLCELGKPEELEFYIRALEKWHSVSPTPQMTYALAVAYRGSQHPRPQQTRRLLEDVIRKEPPGLLRARAKMLLANHLSVVDQEPGTLRSLVDSLFEEPLDEELEILAEIWKTWIHYDSGRNHLALLRVQNLIAAVAVQDYWFASFSCRYLAADLLQREGLHDEANLLLAELRQLYRDKPVASLHRKLSVLERRLSEISLEHRLTLYERERWTLTYRSRTLELERQGTLARLLEGFLSSSYLDKNAIIRRLDGRNYSGVKDDERIYSSIHRLRKKLMELGLPREVIEGNRNNGYRIRLKIEREPCTEA